MPFATLPPGTRLGRFQIQSVLGQGGMGVVYTALDVSAGRTVALKVLPPEFAKDPRFVARFKREGEVAASVSHPNVVSVHFHGKEGGFDVIALELVQGGSLKARLRRGALPWQEAVRCGIEIARGLSAIHGAGLVHRDLKPENVLLDESGHAKVADFGLVAQDGGAQRLTLTGELLGTPEYMAPEQSESAKAVDHRADLYSLGALLYALLVGRPPFEGRAFELIAKHVTAKPRAPSELVKDMPSRLEWLVLRLLEKDPAKRPQTAEEVAGQLEALFGGREAAPRRPFALVAATLVVALGAGGGAYLALAGKSAPPVPPPPPPPPPAVDPVSYTEVDHAPRVEGAVKLVATRGDYRWRTSGGPYSLALLADGKRAASGDSCGGIRLWDLATGHEIRSYETKRTNTLVAVSPDDRKLLVGQDGAFRAFDVETGKELMVLGDGREGRHVWSIAWSPSGRTIFSVSGDDKGHVYYELWDGASGALLHELLPTSPTGVPHGVAFLDERRAVTCSWDNHLLLWDLEKLTDTEIPIEPTYEGQAPNFVATSADGKVGFVVDRYGIVSLVDFERRSVVKVHELGGFDAALSGSASRDGSRFATIGYVGLLWVRGQSGDPWSESVPLARVCAITPDGKRLLTGHEDGVLRWWDVDGRREIARHTAFGGAVQCIDRSGRVAVSMAMGVFEIHDGGPVKSIKNSGWWTEKAALSASGSRLVIPRHFTDRTTELHVYDTRTGEQVKELAVAELPNNSGIDAVALAPDGATFVATDVNGRLRFFETETLRPIKELPCVVAFGNVALFRKGEAWIAASGKAVYMTPPEAFATTPTTPRGTHDDRVTALAGNDRYALSGDKLGRVKLWQLEVAHERDLPRHKGEITALALSSDEKLAATASTDGTVALVPLAPGSPEAKITLVGADYATALNFDRSSKLQVGTMRGIVMTFEVKPR